jgi:RNA polymerase sigma factor (sigma-70 family)
MKFYSLTNLDVKMIYIVNENSESDKWMYDLYERVSFFAENRLRKHKIFLEKEDFLQEANLAIWESIKTFDYHKNFDFYRWMQWQISKKFRDVFAKNKRYSLAKYGINNSINSCTGDVDLEVVVLMNELFVVNKCKLSNRELGILKGIYFEGKTLSEVAILFSISIERVRQIRVNATNKIVDYLGSI